MDQAVANKIQRGMEGVDGHPDPVGSPGDKGEPGLPGIGMVGNDPVGIDESGGSKPESPGPVRPTVEDNHVPPPDYWNPRPPKLSERDKVHQPFYYEGAQMSRHVAIARGIVATEIQGVGVIIDGCLLAGYKLVDIVDIDDPNVVTERAVRRISG